MELRTKFEGLLAYDRWANGEMLASLEAMRAPPAKGLELAGHVLGAEVCWLLRMTAGRDEAEWERWETMDASALRRAWTDELPRRWAAFLGDPAASEGARTFSYVDWMGRSGSACVEDALLQLMFHGAYHRGQIASAVRAAGGAPAVTDLRHGVRTGALESAAGAADGPMRRT